MINVLDCENLESQEEHCVMSKSLYNFFRFLVMFYARVISLAFFKGENGVKRPKIQNVICMALDPK